MIPRIVFSRQNTQRHKELGKASSCAVAFLQSKSSEAHKCLHQSHWPALSHMTTLNQSLVKGHDTMAESLFILQA
jgi:hypothetical protein